MATTQLSESESAQLAADRFIVDQWTSLSTKWAIGSYNPSRGTLMMPGWTGSHRRRLMAYMVLQSYIDNASRHFLASSDLAERNEHREYGDAALLVGQVLAALLGDDQAIVIDDAQALPGVDAIPSAAPTSAQPIPGGEPPAGGEEGSPAEESAETTAEQAAELARQQDAAAMEEWLRDWATAERFGSKLLDCEREAVGLGDGVYVLTWSSKKNRPRLRVYDPGFYFPALGDDDLDFPDKVHLAWEVVRDDDGDYVETQPGVPLPAGVSTATTRRIRRITFEMGPVLDEFGIPVPRVYPWADDDETGEGAVTCYMTDAIFEIAGSQRVDSLSRPVSYATNEDGVEVNALDLEIDFLPVIHLPNNVSDRYHYGQSVLAKVIQLLDDIQAADSDLATTAAIAGTPPIVVSGAMAPTGEVLTYGPGQMFQVGQDGKMEALDLTAGMTALITLIEFLLQRLATNARVPEAVLGRIRGQLPSGIALALSFGPLESLVGEMRLVRDEKYPLLFRFVQRMAIAGGALPIGTKVESAKLTFGSYLPADRQQAVTQVTELLNAHAVSRLTAVGLLIESGFTIDDAEAEVERIKHELFDEAVRLLDATGDEQAVRDYLGLEGPPPEPAPVATPATGRPGVALRFTQPGQPGAPAPAGAPAAAPPAPPAGPAR